MSSAQDEEIYVKVAAKGATDSYSAWDDGAGGQLKQILIWHGDIIYGIQTTYERNGTTVLSPRHGGTEGDFEAIWFNEPLTWISGHYGSYCLDPEIFASEDEAPDNYCTVIRSLQFGTSRATYGPFGRERGRPFSFKMGTGCAGLHGKADTCHLYAIGVYVRGMAKSFIGATPSPSTGNLSSEPMLESTDESKGQSLTSGAPEGEDVL